MAIESEGENSKDELAELETEGGVGRGELCANLEAGEYRDSVEEASVFSEGVPRVGLRRAEKVSERMEPAKIKSSPDPS